MVSPRDFAKIIINRMGFPETENNINALIVWQAAEGGHYVNTAYFNPLNTAWKMPGSTFFNRLTPDFGVQRYTNWDQGIDATVNTLKMGIYQPIRDSFMKDAPTDETLRIIGGTPWGTYSLKTMTAEKVKEYLAYGDKADPITSTTQAPSLKESKIEPDDVDLEEDEQKDPHPHVTQLENALKQYFDKVSNNKNTRVKFSSNNNINNIECARKISNFLDSRLEDSTTIYTDNNVTELECSADNDNILHDVCCTITDNFNKKYGSDITFEINKQASVTKPISFKKEFLNYRMFKLLNASKNG